MSPTVQPDAICWWTADPDDDDDSCMELSRFVVERDDEDTSYEPAESCDQHLAETVAALADGDENVKLIVTIRWDAPKEADR